MGCGFPLRGVVLLGLGLLLVFLFLCCLRLLGLFLVLLVLLVLYKLWALVRPALLPHRLVYLLAFCEESADLPRELGNIEPQLCPSTRVDLGCKLDELISLPPGMSAFFYVVVSTSGSPRFPQL